MNDDAPLPDELRHLLDQEDLEGLIASGRIATVELWEHLLYEHGWDPNRRLSLPQADAEAWHQAVQPHRHLNRPRPGNT
jgi:hypothetical protein